VNRSTTHARVVIPDARSAIRNPGDRRAACLPLGSGFAATRRPGMTKLVWSFIKSARYQRICVVDCSISSAAVITRAFIS
jgi:hypothetical protein